MLKAQVPSIPQADGNSHKIQGSGTPDMADNVPSQE